jgi:ABC-type polar amino acid transport system ATPase subunit
MDTIVGIKSACKSYGGNQVLRDVSLDFERGEVSVILGPSGSGKTTVLRAISLLGLLDSGYVTLNGSLHGYTEVDSGHTPLPERRLAACRRQVGMVFQQFNLFPHLTALENVMLAPVKVLGHDRKVAQAAAEVLLERVGLADQGRSLPAELSGGQQQRVAIARALALKPNVMLFDEPTSALDPEMVSEVLDVMVELAAEGVSMVVVSHEMGFARKVAHNVTFMERGEVIARGRPDDIFGSEAHPRIREFMAKIL